MRPPSKPPAIKEIIGDKGAALFEAMTRKNADTEDYVRLANWEYRPWDKIRSHQPKPKGFDAQTLWYLVSVSRCFRTPIPLMDQQNHPFTYWLPDRAQGDLHQIDLQMGGSVGIGRLGTKVTAEPRYLLNSLMDEAISSSQIEGAVATREQARIMLREGKTPQNESEQMILNNYLTIRKLSALKDQPLSIDMIHEIQAMLTENTNQKPGSVGRFRKPGENIHVMDTRTNEIIFTPPPANELKDRMQKLCDFANANSTNPFIHPVVKAILMHFWLAYDHPYCDGNGRTARALFYWQMLRQGYWRFEYMSISQIIKSKPAQYVMAYLHSEMDDNDATYFTMFHLMVIRQAMQQLDKYLREKENEIEEMTGLLDGLIDLNQRQKVLLYHAIRHSNASYTIESHMNSNDVTYPTARNDLLQLAKQGYLVQKKRSKKFRFTPVPNLNRKLQEEQKKRR